MAGFFVAGIALAWIFYAVESPPAISDREEDKEQL
jgi:hypothetical protein